MTYVQIDDQVNHDDQPDEVEQAPVEDAVVGAGAAEAPSDEAAPAEGAAEAVASATADESESGSRDEPASPPDDQIRRYEDMLARERAERERLEGQQFAVEQEKRQIAQQKAQEQWDQLQRQARRRADGMGYQEGLDHMQQFYQQREQALMQTAQQMTQQATTEQYRQHVIEEYGLTKDDAALLGADPYQFDSIGRSLKQRNESTQSEISSLRKEMEQLRRQAQAQQRLQSGVDQTGGSTGRPLPNDLSQLPTKDHLRALMEQGGML